MKKIIIIIFFMFILCGCETEMIDEKIPFVMECVDAYQNNNNVIFEKEENVSTIILPTNTVFFDDDSLIKNNLYCFNTETKESVNDIKVDLSNIKINEAGIYDVIVHGENDNYFSNTYVKVKLIDSCSDNCNIETTNWIYSIINNIEFTQVSGDYRTINLEVKMSPKENAYGNLNFASYGELTDGFIILRYLTNCSFYTTVVADDEEEFNDQLTNALSLIYRRNSKFDKTYIKFRVVPEIKEEAYIDFYDKIANKHNFYYLNK